MATPTNSCGICELRHITKPSIIWCTECDEGLCIECKEHHSLSKSSRNHCVIPFTEYEKLPADILKITQYCTKHDKKYQIYCQKHEFPCCNKCIVEIHKECRDFVELDDVIHNVKTSNAMCEIEETLVEVAENLQKIRQHQQDNLTTFKESRKEIEKEIKKTRIKINNHLDKLQEDLMKQLYAIEEKENSKICQLLSTLEKKEKEIAECQRNIMNMKQHATDLQVFLSMKQIEEDVYSKNKFLQLLEEGRSFKQTSLSYKINNSIQNIMSDIKCFGEVRIEAKSCDIVLIRKKAKQAQMMVPTVQSRSIENITLTKQKTINTQGDCITGCCMLSDGRMAFTYYFDCKVIILNMKGITDFEVKMPCNVFDIVYISEDNTLGVTSGGSGKTCITIIDLEKKQIKKTISLDSTNYGITLKDNGLVYSAHNKGIRMINLHDESISDVVRDKMPSNCYIATFRDNIYHTNYQANTVTCYNLQGEIQWTFKNESVLEKPRGIDVDSDGNVYVVGYSSKNVVVISPDGQRHREVWTTKDGLDIPFSLHYSGPRKQMLVANFHNTVHLFNVI
ncbi:uncharacterized protein LOC127705450 isoform X1 [Mytilus californianus]|uniref:uncharacterized protein LOC127705450 isoform X1 n=1 Tax=Mytilus californianus TaxID=6549 RepID=UPI0022456306|nr:uncharacterized protein LOC127705450 isoform X1 [Mytilus californianus]